MKTDMEKDDGFCIKVYSPGNFIAKEITINGGVHLGNNPATGGFSDEQVAKALTASASFCVRICATCCAYAFRMRINACCFCAISFCMRIISACNSKTILCM